MRIKNLQRSLRERGMIRLGYSTPRNDGNKTPHKLDKFRFTTPDRATIEQVAALYGGEPREWEGGRRDRFEVISERDAIPVVMPTQMSFSQCYEQYRNGFPTKRCDGERCLKPSTGRRLVDGPCECDPDERECSTTTHLSLILPELAGLGVWRLVSHGWYAAVELATTVELIESAMAVGMRVPARLFLERREVRRIVNNKPTVRKFVVPALDLDVSVAALGAGSQLALPMDSASEPVEIDQAPTPTGWQPVQTHELPEAPLVTIEEQLRANEIDPPRRKNATPPIARTGLSPRSAVDAERDVCEICSEPYGTRALVRNPNPSGSRFVHSDCARAMEEPESVPATEAVGDRGGPPDDDTGSVAVEPAPVAAGGIAVLTGTRKRELFAVLAEAFPRQGDESGPVTDERRKQHVIELAALFGQTIGSRNDLDAPTARLVIDALRAISAGDLVLLDGQLHTATNGERIDFETWRAAQ